MIFSLEWLSHHAELTKHGVKRMRKRLGINASGCGRATTKAWEKGLTLDEVPEAKWLLQNVFAERVGRLTPDGVFIFSESGTLVTVLKLHPNLRQAVVRAWKEKREKENGNGNGA